MLYYLGKGTEFKKEDCKEYKKLDAALKAAAKDERLIVWDETGKVIGSLTDDVPEGALQRMKFPIWRRCMFHMRWLVSWRRMGNKKQEM